MTARIGIPEDIMPDPQERRRLTLARHLLGIAINRMSKERSQGGSLWGIKAGQDDVKTLAIEEGLIWYDDWHHAPTCPANNWGRQRLSEGPCTCGAAKRQIR